MSDFGITIYQCPNSFQEPKNAHGFTQTFTIKSGDTATLAKAIQFDNCPAQYKDGYRIGKNFLQANCLLADIDNTHSDEPSKWITHEDVKKAFPDVILYYYPSRNHMKEKDGKKARPKEHYIFPIGTVTSVEEYTGLMKLLIDAFPELYFDPAVKGGAQLNFGVKNPQVTYVDGKTNLYDFLKSIEYDITNKQADNTIEKVDYSKKIENMDIIPEGQRNSTLCSHAARTLKRYGDRDSRAYQLFMQGADKCVPPLDNSELENIWKGALKFYQQTILPDPEYILPEQYSFTGGSHKIKPSDFTDVGQARVFSNIYEDKLRFSKATQYIFYTGMVWNENELRTRGLAQQLTDVQLKEARSKLKEAENAIEDAVLKDDADAENKAKTDLKYAEAYLKHVLKCRSTQRINGVLVEAQPMLEIDVECLDKKEFKLNTPSGTIDLRTKQMSIHNPKDYCTKMTLARPENKGTELFNDFLKVITCGDKSLEDYLQLIAGMSAIGKVYCENLIIAYGSGRNGKSTFFNLLAKVMGDYFGSISAEILTVKSRKNKYPEYAELRGKRLVIAAELEEGMRLDTAVVKHLCSTDPIQAEKKFKAPFHYIPSHTIVLYTNHLPCVGTSDAGTWRRLVVVPFNAVIEGVEEIKNYTDYLFNNAGGAVLTWVIEGAKKFIDAGYKIEQPEAVKQMIEQYRSDNDWINKFISECCETDSAYEQKAGILYEKYRDYCSRTGEFARKSSELKTAIEGAGFKWKKTNKGAFYHGLRLLSETNPEPDSLPPYYVKSDVTVGDTKKQDF